jgi:hypothetical protein
MRTLEYGLFVAKYAVPQKYFMGLLVYNRVFFPKYVLPQNKVLPQG